MVPLASVAIPEGWFMVLESGGFGAVEDLRPVCPSTPSALAENVAFVAALSNRRTRLLDESATQSRPVESKASPLGWDISFGVVALPLVVKLDCPSTPLPRRHR